MDRAGHGAGHQCITYGVDVVLDGEDQRGVGVVRLEVRGGRGGDEALELAAGARVDGGEVELRGRGGAEEGGGVGEGRVFGEWAVRGGQSGGVRAGRVREHGRREREMFTCRGRDARGARRGRRCARCRAGGRVE